MVGEMCKKILEDMCEDMCEEMWENVLALACTSVKSGTRAEATVVTVTRGVIL